MRLINESPFRVLWTVGKVRPPATSVTILVKGTFGFSPADPVPEQEMPTGDSADYPSDFVPFKPKADLLVVGPFRSIRVGAFAKSGTKFGPIPVTDPGRRRKAGTFDGEWLRTRWPWFPADFQPSFHNSAPEDQQVPYLRGDEAIRLDDRAATLPGRRVRALFCGREVPMNLDTLWTDGARIILVWRGVADLRSGRLPDDAVLYVASEPVDRPREASDYAFLLQEALEKREEIEVDPAPEGETPVLPEPPSREWCLSRESLAGLDLSGVDLSGAVLRASLAGAILTRAKLAGADLVAANLEGAVLSGADLSQAKLERAVLRGADLAGANLERSDLSRAELAGADFSEARLRGARLAGAAGEGTLFTGADLRRADLAGGRFARADFSRAALDDADLSRAELREAVLESARGSRLRLDGADLRGVRAAGARFPDSGFRAVRAHDSIWPGALLSGADFSNAFLPRAEFEGAYLADAKVSGADLRRARLVRVNLRCAALTGANLLHASLAQSDLTGADLAGANLFEADLHETVHA